MVTVPLSILNSEFIRKYTYPPATAVVLIIAPALFTQSLAVPEQAELNEPP